MRFFSIATTISAVAAFTGHASATGCNATAPIKGPFSLTVVMEDGSSTYATNVRVASGGLPVLNPVVTSTQQFTWDTKEGRIFRVGDATSKSAKVSEGSTLHFVNNGSVPDDGKWLLEQKVSNCSIYLVKKGTTDDEGVYQWESTKPGDMWNPTAVTWEGSGKDSNAAIRLDIAPDTTKPSKCSSARRRRRRQF